MTDRPGGNDRIRRRDELLQVLFWLEGEEFESEMTLQGIARFLARTEDEVRPVLDAAVMAGLVERLPDGRFELSRSGRHEGGRRFLEEFAELRARDTHSGTCADPDCECHAAGSAIACIHRRQEDQHEDSDRR